MAQYMLLLYNDPSEWRQLSPEEMQKGIEKYIAWTNQARQSGFWLASHKLADDLGRVMRGHGGQPRVTDGPYSESKEVLGGYYLIEASNYDQAVQRSLDHPHLVYGGTIEVRQVDVLQP